MRTPIEVRNDAMECLRRADQAKSPQHKTILLLMAQGWALLAEQMEIKPSGPEEEKVEAPSLAN
jgi:hypothetical protein